MSFLLPHHHSKDETKAGRESVEKKHYITYLLADLWHSYLFDMWCKLFTIGIGCPSLESKKRYLDVSDMLQNCIENSDIRFYLVKSLLVR